MTLAELMLANGDKNAAIKLIRYVLDNFEDNFDLKQKAEEINGKFNVGSQDWFILWLDLRKTVIFSPKSGLHDPLFF